MYLPRAIAASVVALAGALLAGCPGTVLSPYEPRGDAAYPDGAPYDAGPPPSDAGPRGSAPLFAHCNTANDCQSAPGVVGVTCLTDLPGGACSRRCTADGDCGAGGYCINNVCLVRCTAGGNECAALQAACDWVEDDNDTVRVCVASCTPTDLLAPGAPGCGPGLTCDPYSGACETPPLPTGVENGGPCTDDTQCRGGACRLDTDYGTGHPSGFVGGYCASYARQPLASAYVTDAPMPRSNCPLGSVVLPYGAQQPGDYVACYRDCTADTDCRPGYFCEHGDDITGQHVSTGGCVPVDCTQPGRTCPSGTVCYMDDGSYLGHPVCGRPAAGM